MSEQRLLADIELFKQATDAYYNGSAIMDDTHFDAIEARLTSYMLSATADPTHSSTIARLLSKVGAAPRDTGWRKVKHSVPMGSLFKARDIVELNRWAAPLQCNGYMVTLKCDGISVQLTYTKGMLWQALTRGDGETGEDITRNVLKMKGVLKEIQGFSGTLRGEIMLTKTDHAAYFPTYANTRNAAAGIAKREDGKGCEHLTVYFYRLMETDLTHRAHTKSRELDNLTMYLEVPFVPSVGYCDTIKEVATIYQEYIDGARSVLDIDIDGLVVEVNDLTYFNQLGDVNGRPKGAIALKFPAEIKAARLEDVQWQTGSSGRITPVAIFSAVNIMGATITQASLHNVAYMRRLAAESGRSYLQVGDELDISRRNDVIPYVEEVVYPNYNGDYFMQPDCCVSCEGDLVQDGEYLQCLNPECPAQVVGAISNWLVRIGIRGLGAKVIAAMVDKLEVQDASDLYRLDPDDIASITYGEGTGTHTVGRAAYTMYEALHNKKVLPLATFLGALSIAGCSKTICRSVVDAGYDTIDKIKQLTVYDIVSIPGMGMHRANSFVNGIKYNEGLISRLLANCVTIAPKSEGPLKGVTVCFTGIRAPDIEHQIEQLGGTIKTSVVNGLTYLVQYDATSTSGKSTKARAQGVTIVSLEGIRQIIAAAQVDALLLNEVDDDIDF